MWRTGRIACYRIHVIQNSKWLVPLHYSVKDQPDRRQGAVGVKLLSDTVKEERSTIRRCLMKGDLAFEVELMAEVMKVYYCHYSVMKLWGTVLKSSPQYMKSLNDNSVNGRGNHNVRVR